MEIFLELMKYYLFIVNLYIRNIFSCRCTTTIKFDDSSTQNSSIEHDSVEFVIENASPCIEDEKPEISLDNVEKEGKISKFNFDVSVCVIEYVGPMLVDIV